MDDEYKVEMDEWKEQAQEAQRYKEQAYEAKSLLLAPNYVKDVNVNFGEKYSKYGYADVNKEPRRKLTISIEVNPVEADKLRSMPGMDDAQFVAFLMPCIQTSILKTIQQGMGERKQKNQVEIVEMNESTNMENYEMEKYADYGRDCPPF
jgi:hypothetical protein